MHSIAKAGNAGILHRGTANTLSLVYAPSRKPALPANAKQGQVELPAHYLLIAGSYPFFHRPCALALMGIISLDELQAAGVGYPRLLG